MQYTGDIITSEYDVLNILKGPHPHYIMELNTHWLKGDSRKGNITRFINHSCDPNCMIVNWLVNDVEKVFFVSMYDIKPHSWITYDYNFRYHKERNFDDIPMIKCHCNSNKCKKYF